MTLPPEPWLPPSPVTPAPPAPPVHPGESGAESWAPPSVAPPVAPIQFAPPAPDGSSAPPAPMPQFAPPAFPAPGGPAGPAGPAGPPDWQPEKLPRDRKSRRRIITWVSVGVGLAVLAGGAAVAVSMINDSRDPAAQVEEYLDLLASGQAEAASKLVNPGVADASLLTDEVLGAATERITVRSVETLERAGEHARVLARLSLGGEDFQREFTVDHGPNELLVLQTWELNEPLTVEATLGLRGPVSAGSVPAVVNVGGSEVVLANAITGDDAATVSVYPGVYDVAPGGLGSYLESSGAELVAGAPGVPAEVVLTADFNDAFAAEILAQATAYADGCVLVGGNEVVSGNMDEACPMTTRDTKLSELKVAKYPKAFSHLGEKLFMTEPYEFEVRGTSAQARLRTASSSLSGEISWKDGEPTLVDAQFGWW